MKIIAFIEADQGGIIRNILEHCGLWEDRPSRSPPRPRPQPVRWMLDAEDGIRYEINPDFLEYARREAACGGVPEGISEVSRVNCPGRRESGPEIAHFVLEPGRD